MSNLPFTRQLGARSGVQLNFRKDNTEGFAGGNADQSAAFAIRSARGRTDRSFKVNRSNYKVVLGDAASIAASQLNEGYVQVYEFFRAGGNEAIISRLITNAAVNNLIICTASAVTAVDVWTTAATAPGTETLTIRHHENFADGVTASINAIAMFQADGVTPVASTDVNLVLRDINGAELLNVTGSLLSTAKDDSGKSRFLPDVVTQFTDAFTVTVRSGATVATTSLIYGKDANGAAKFVTEHMTYYTEGGTGYVEADYDAAIDRIRRSEHSFGYIGGAGTQAASLITKLISLGKEMNKQVAWDIPGNLGITAALAFYRTVGGTDSEYSQCYWSPLLHDDPVSGGKAIIGKSGMQLGFRCQRNAQTNSYGLAPKNYPVAGKNWSVVASGISQIVRPTTQELDTLAENRINPVISQRFASGSRYVFMDSLTGAKSETIKKLISVADMSCQVDDDMASYASECLQLPMKETIKRLTDFMQKYFEGAEASGWIVPSDELEGRSFVGNVVPNAQRPFDRVDVTYSVRYDGAVRAIYVTQTYSK